MKVSLNAVKEFTDVEISVDELVAKIGAQLGAVEAVYESGAKYDGVLVVRIVSCEKHPNADKLNVCLIDDGGVAEGVDRNNDGLVQVVCGAPNARAGITVAWLPPGATVPNTYWADPFVLEARELRGQRSNGMLASPSELAISDSHDGILEIDEDITPGTPFKQLYGLDDVTIEIENKMFTHRPDCFGVLGVAREIAGIQNKPFTSPDWYLNFEDGRWKMEDGEKFPLEVSNEVPELVPRFMAVAMSNVTIKPSPVWLQALLTRVNIKPINNVVDVTNYLAYITAQPLHAYDYDKVKERSHGEAKLIVRKPAEGETIALLNGKTITPRKDAIMIATDKELIGIGGIMGGITTEVDEHTRNIIIECANFDMYSIRKTSMEHGLFTEAVTRFNKGQSPLQNDRVIARAMKMMGELAGAQQASNIVDNSNRQLEVFAKNNNFKAKDGQPVKVFEWGHLTAPITLDSAFINSRLGTNLSAYEISQLLRNVEISAWQDNQEDKSEIEVIPPFWRTDIQIEEDVVEEVGRLLGFDKMPLDLPKRTVTPTKVDKNLNLKKDLRTKLAAMGANEVLTYSFVHGKLLERAGQNAEIAFKLTNALSPDVQYYRLSLTPSLLAYIHPNSKSGHDRFALFEIGKVHSKTEIDETGVPREFGRVSLVLADKNNQGAAFYQAKEYLQQLTGGVYEVVPFDEARLQSKLMAQMVTPYEPSRSAMLLHESGLVVGIVGEFKTNVQKAFKLPNYCAGFELFLSAAGTGLQTGYVPLSRYPSTTQDICFEVSRELPYGELATSFEEAVAMNTGGELKTQIELVDIYTSDELKDKKRITFRLEVVSYERTLTDEVLDSMLGNITELLASKHGALRV